LSGQVTGELVEHGFFLGVEITVLVGIVETDRSGGEPIQSTIVDQRGGGNVLLN
jgi:hypothetical protein